MMTETIEFYKEGFFGYGNDGEFQYWSLAHFVPIVVLAVVVCLIYRFRKNLIKFRHEEEVRFLLGGLCLFFWMSYYWRLLYVGNEGNGLTDETANLADYYIRIPMLGQIESLNAAMAAGILVYDAARQRRIK